METTSKYGKCVACVTNQTSLEERIKQLVDKVDVANLKYSQLLQHVEHLNKQLHDRDESRQNSKTEDGQALFYS